MAREYSADTKAAVLAALLAGQSMRDVVREYGVPRTTIIGWQRRGPQGSDAVFLSVEAVATVKKTALIPELVLDLMIARLQAQIALAQHCGDKTWLSVQGADALAILLGVQDDKLYRMLEALDRARSRAGSAPG